MMINIEALQPSPNSIDRRMTFSSTSEYPEMRVRITTGHKTGDFSSAISYLFDLLLLVDEKTSKQIYPFLLELLPHFNTENFNNLIDSVCEYLPRLLTNSRELHEEQWHLSLELADWCIKNIHSQQWLDSYLKAMYYFSKSIQIADQHKYKSKETHIKTSQLFIRLIDEHLIKNQSFVSMLDTARKHNHLDKFRMHLKQIKDLKGFFYQAESGKVLETLYDVLSRYFQNIAKNTPKEYIDNYVEILKERHIFPNLEKCTTERYHEELKKFRLHFENVSWNILDENISQQVRGFQANIVSSFREYFKMQSEFF